MDHAGRSEPAATKLPLGITVTSDSSLPPAKRDFKPHKLSPQSPCSSSLIKIERTHVPISLLLEGCCGVYASSLHTGTKFEYHLHLPGRQQIPHQKHMLPLPPPFSSARHRLRQTGWHFLGTRPLVCMFSNPLDKAPPGDDRGPPQLERHSEWLLITLLLAKSGLYMHRRDSSWGSHKDSHCLCPCMSWTLGGHGAGTTLLEGLGDGRWGQAHLSLLDEPWKLSEQWPENKHKGTRLHWLPLSLCHHQSEGKNLEKPSQPTGGFVIDPCIHSGRGASPRAGGVLHGSDLPWPDLCHSIRLCGQ